MMDEWRKNEQNRMDEPGDELTIAVFRVQSGIRYVT